MNTEFVTAEQALALKELGFDEFCLGYHTFYDNSANYFVLSLGSYNSGVNSKSIKTIVNTKKTMINAALAPMYQQAFQFLLSKANVGLGFDEIILDIYNFKLIEKCYTRDIIENELASGKNECLNKLIELVKK